jgi:predicted DNA binding CopG/RHH family protein
MKKRSLPKMNTDAQATKVMESDLSAYIAAGAFKPVTFELSRKSKTITLRMPEQLFKSLKGLAREKDMPYQRMIRVALEDYLHRAA